LDLNYDLKNKKIILAVTGSIAAYKAVYLLRLLVKSGAEVRVIMTPAATDFVQPLSFSVLSGYPVAYRIQEENEWNSHVDLGLWADMMLIAPCTANTMAGMAHGLAHNLLLSSYLSLRCPVFISPAMDVDMWNHPSTQDNVEILKKRGAHILPVGKGELASGLIGAGRMSEPEEIVEYLNDYFGDLQELKGKSILITAGPTYEPIDPVRYLGNRSSGKMGIALAEECAGRGAKVTLVLGPTYLNPASPGISCIRVQTAEEMYEESVKAFSSVDIAILAAAVSDFKPKSVSSNKIKKKRVEDKLELELVKTRDIAAHLGKLKNDRQLILGFALETNNEVENALKKLEQKNFDLIVLNSLNDKGAGFNVDTNKISILSANNKIKNFELKSKQAVATDIVNVLIESLKD
jgi:phosphopantothenoylcysteine decarboxylase/phosphopantothenate--cysteine ligase